MTVLHLIRHGETDWNAAGRLQGKQDSMLTELGKQQTWQVAERLSAYRFDGIISSTSTRAVQTAGILARSLNVTHIAQDYALCEISLGPWEGRFKEEIAQEYPKQFNAFRYEPDRFFLDGAESFMELQKRGMDAIAGIVGEYHNKELLIVSHGALVKSILCYFAGRALRHLWRPPKLNNCGHSILEFKSSESAVITLFADQHSW